MNSNADNPTTPTMTAVLLISCCGVLSGALGSIFCAVAALAEFRSKLVSLNHTPRFGCCGFVYRVGRVAVGRVNF